MKPRKNFVGTPLRAKLLRWKNLSHSRDLVATRSELSQKDKGIGASTQPFAPLATAVTTLLEAALPFRELSLVAKADRRASDPVYSTHKWWARRPPGVIRGLLLAALAPAAIPTSEYWARFASSEGHLGGRRVHDMFAGGGAMLVEAARLGAVPSGTDVDPLAVQIVSHELQPPDPEELKREIEALLQSVQSLSELYPRTNQKWLPLHYFYLHSVVCPHCRKEGLLYKNLVLARHLGKHGGVIRDHVITCFCPECLKIHGLGRRDQKNLRCCGRNYPLGQGTFKAGKFTCPHCSRRSDHVALQTGSAKRVLIAVEETSDEEYRRIRKPRELDTQALLSAEDFVTQNQADLDYPCCKLETDRADGRPVSFGIKTADQLFTSRQLAVFGTAFRVVRERVQSPSVSRALLLGLSNALTTNNRLCSYAFDYGRLAPLFSVRSYSLPWLAVELNPLHPTAGRGTLARAMRKILRSTSGMARRYIWDEQHKKVIAKKLDFTSASTVADVRCVSAEKPLDWLEPVDVCIFDPPYFDYIAYSELSEFYRLWQSKQQLGGEPLLPTEENPTDSFGIGLGNCLLRVLAVLKEHRPLAFTFHSLSKDAWTSIGIALDHAKLSVTAVWPVLNDAHMGHHGANGNCEWDLVVVARRASECAPGALNASVEDWAESVRPLRIGKADKKCMELAVAVLRSRFAKVRT